MGEGTKIVGFILLLILAPLFLPKAVVTLAIVFLVLYLFSRENRLKTSGSSSNKIYRSSYKEQVTESDIDDDFIYSYEDFTPEIEMEFHEEKKDDSVSINSKNEEGNHKNIEFIESSETGIEKEFSDYNGNVYKTEFLTNLLWTTENFRGTKLKGNRTIEYADSKEIWKELCENEIPAYCNFNYTSRNRHTNTHYYNIHVCDYLDKDGDSNFIFKNGWRIPNYEDIMEFQNEIDESIDLNLFESGYVDLFANFKNTSSRFYMMLNDVIFGFSSLKPCSTDINNISFRKDKLKKHSQNLDLISNNKIYLGLPIRLCKPF